MSSKNTAYEKIKELTENVSKEWLIDALGNYMNSDELDDFNDFLEDELE